jgi:hypothetical protein
MKMKSTGPPPIHEKFADRRRKIATNCNPDPVIVDKIAQYATFCNNLISGRTTF